MAECNTFRWKKEHRIQDTSTASLPNTARARNGGPRHPPHLRGKEIGLYYARLNRERKNKEYAHAAGNSGSYGHFHRQKYHEVPSILHCEDLRRTLREIANAVIPYSGKTNDYTSHIPKKCRSVENFDEIDSSLERNEEIDRNLYQSLVNRANSSSPLQAFRAKLPACKMQLEILSAVEQNQVVVVMGETGCGKTTQIPQFILDSFISAGKGSLCKIVCTQPRRISAITVAERVAQERGVACGQKSEVGYQIRLENEMPADQGSILFCTTGIVLQWLQDNPLLNGITHIIVDEVHERDMLCDFLLIILKDILKVREDLKVILMSATLDRENISTYFGGCPTIQIPGLTFPVEVLMLEDVIEMIGYDADEHLQGKKKHSRMSKQLREQNALEYDAKSAYLSSLESRYSPQTVKAVEFWNEEEIDLNLVACLIKHICLHEKGGAILVFLPGWEQIKKMKTLITKDRYICPNSLIVPLHSLMPTINQREAFEKPADGIRKIVLATNIAETSITIDDIVFVIDAGKIKMQNFDHSHDIATLKPEWVAKSNAKQRKGRAGRTQSGICYRLYTKFREERLEDYQLPEMLRVRLEEIILRVKLLKLGFAQEFLHKAMDPPSEVMIAKSVDLLKKLDALDEFESLTPLGYHLAQLPMAPQLSKMCILGAVFSCLDPVLSIAASLSFREPFMIPMGREKEVDNMKKTMACNTCSDHMLLCRIIEEYESSVRRGYGPKYCYDHFLSSNTLKMLVNLKGQLAEHLYKLKFTHSCDPKDPSYNRNSCNVPVLKAIICGGLYPNVAILCRNAKKHVPPKLMDNSSGTVQFHPKSVNCDLTNCEKKLFVYFLKVKSSQNFLHDSSIVNFLPVVLFGHIVEVCGFYNCETVCIDQWLHLKCPLNTAELVKAVGEKVRAFLHWKFISVNEHCENIHWPWEKAFVENTVKLINEEHNLSLFTGNE